MHANEALVDRLIERSRQLAESLDLGSVYYHNIWQVILQNISGEKATAIERAIEELITLSEGKILALDAAQKRAREIRGETMGWPQKLLALAAERQAERDAQRSD